MILRFRCHLRKKNAAHGYRVTPGQNEKLNYCTESQGLLF